MKNLKTYDELILESRKDDDIGLYILEYIKKHGDDITFDRFKKDDIKFEIGGSNKTEEDPHGEEIDEQNQISINIYKIFGSFCINVDDEEVKISSSIKKEIVKYLKNIKELKENKKKQEKIEKFKKIIKNKEKEL